MRLVLQRVAKASVSVDGEIVGAIDRGYLLLLCVMRGDTQEQAKRLAEKIVGMRLFDGEDGRVNDRSLADVGGGVLIVSQFTLSADLDKGRRPDYTAAASAEEAKSLYEFFVAHCRSLGIASVQTGLFGAMMEVTLTNDGPVTIFFDTEA